MSGHVPNRPVALSELRGKTVAVDASNLLYTFLTTLIDHRTGSLLTSPDGRVTSHLLGLFRRNAALLQAGVRPIYCFDGKSHPLKAATLAARNEIRGKAQAEHKAAVAAGDLTLARKKAAQAVVLNRDMVEDAKRLLDVLGMPWVQAACEGEAQAIHLVNNGHADLVATTDWDALAMGAPRVVRHFSSSENSKIPPTLVELQEALGALGCTREELVCAAVLMGTDYNEGVRGIGPKKGVKLAKQYAGDVRACLRALSVEMPHAEEVYQLLLDPPANTVYSIAWGKPRRKDALALCEKWGFTDFETRTLLVQYDLALDPPRPKQAPVKAAGGAGELAAPPPYTKPWF
ncbi:MAG TPA: flap structure-specific endonuclease [Candidatus Thermoplasmatota archaeon]|nr:flap structure-specific endonuclease [Candidatus Thermoplasmatota archaeon]